MKPIKKIALLHSLCCVGKASMTNMIPILSTMGIEACPLPTVLLSTHTGGFRVPAKHELDGTFIRSSANHFVENGVHFDAIFVGYLGDGTTTSDVIYFLDCFPDATVIVDPIMGDDGNFYQNRGLEHWMTYLELSKRADIILPNLTEACLLAGKDYDAIKTETDIDEICTKLHTQGVPQIVLTGISKERDSIAIVVSQKEERERLLLPKEQESFHGTGDVFDAVFIGHILNGANIIDASLKAHEFTASCIRASLEDTYPKREGLLLEKCLSLLV